MINFKVIFHIIGFLLILEGIFILGCISASLLMGSNDVLPLLISGGSISILGLILFFLTKLNSNDEVKKREGYLIVSLGWLSMSLMGAIPFVVSGVIPDYTNAFFETVSGFTTTGASILNDIESVPAGLLLWRSLTQWLGGMGIIVLSLAIFPLLGIGGMQLFIAEVPGVTKDKIHPRIKETAKRLWGIYVLLTFTQALLLAIGGMSLFDAVNHAFTTMATGGFSTKQASIEAYDSPFIHYVIIFFMFAAGVNFNIHYYLLHKKFSVLKQNEEFSFYWKLILFFTLVVFLLLIINSSFGVENSFRLSLFHVVSLITTTGFVSANYELWAPFAQIVFFVLLFFGGCAGSTGGGIKIVRHLLLYKNSMLELRRLIHPQAIIPVRFNSVSVKPDIILNVLAFFLFYIFIFVAGSIALCFFGVDFISAIGAAATCIGNVGPGIGTVGPAYNFYNIPDGGKWILSFLMLLGRLELFTILIIFSRSFWKH